MSFAKGLALPHSIPMAVIPSMESLMWSKRDELNRYDRALCIFRSHKDQVFSAALGNYPEQRLQLEYGTLAELEERRADCDGFFSNDPTLSFGERPVQQRALTAEMLIRVYLETGLWPLDADLDRAQVMYGLEYKAKKWTK